MKLTSISRKYWQSIVASLLTPFAPRAPHPHPNPRTFSATLRHETQRLRKPSSGRSTCMWCKNPLKTRLTLSMSCDERIGR